MSYFMHLVVIMEILIGCLIESVHSTPTEIT